MQCSGRKLSRLSAATWRSGRMLHALFQVLCIGLLGSIAYLPSAQAGTDAACRAIWKEPEVDIKVVSAAPSLDHGKSSDQIERIAKKSGFAKSSSHANLLGLTHSSTGPTLSAATNSQEVVPGKYCVRLDRVRLTIGSRKTNVYIDRKYRKTSCAYKTILAHEMEHVRINEQIVQDYVPKIRQELQERAAGIEPFYTKNPKKARRSIANRLLFELDPLLEEFNEARLRANDVIDTPEAYAATQAKCRDW